MKYIDVDLLRKEIEFAKSVYSNPERVVHGIADAFRQDGRAAMCDDILKKLDSLQQEQPEVDLEKEIVETLGDDVWNDTSVRIQQILIKVAHHLYELYELGKSARKEE